MSEFNLNISVSNLTQVDRLQNDSHRLPMVHQLQNAQAAHDEMGKRTVMPVEPDTIEKKNIDSERKKNERDGRGKRHRSVPEKIPEQNPDRSNVSSIIDVTV